MINLIGILIISTFANGQSISKQVDKDATRVVMSKYDISLLNVERAENGLDFIGNHETEVDLIIQDDLDKQLEDKINAFKNNKKIEMKQMPLVEKWGHMAEGREPKWAKVIRERVEARGHSFRNAMEAIIYENPKRKKEVKEFYQNNCKYNCPKMDGSK